jgi:hypothetical protein
LLSAILEALICGFAVFLMASNSIEPALPLRAEALSCQGAVSPSKCCLASSYLSALSAIQFVARRPQALVVSEFDVVFVGQADESIRRFSLAPLTKFAGTLPINSIALQRALCHTERSDSKSRSRLCGSILVATEPWAVSRL